MTNIALVVLDTLRKDVFDEYFDWLPGRRFEHAYSTSHRTVPAHASLFTGKYASEIGVGGEHEHLDCEEQVLAEQLQSVGYTTRAFSANPYVSQQFGYDRGFEHFGGSWRLDSFDDDVFDWGVFIANSQDEGPIRYARALWNCVVSDCDTLQSLAHGATLKLYDTGVGPFEMDDGAKNALDVVRNTPFGDDEFFFLNLMEAHAPYNPPSEFRTVEEPEFDGISATLGDDNNVDTDRLRQSYEDSVRYLSDVYRDIFAELRSEFDYVITLADHGELLGEHGAWNHCYGVFPELTHVPLVVSSDEHEVIRDRTVVSLLDVHRTVLDLAGVSGDSRGRDLLDDPESGAFLAEYRGLTPRQLDRLEGEGFDYETLTAYDEPLDGLAAPKDYYGYETRDGFIETGTSRSSNPWERLDALRDELSRDEASGARGDVSDSVLKQLEDLGYT
ncbi:sulfatase-like hydrolase/transferase [Halorussus salinus]|uniref:sulfatase-like hydrolase/transferase n=1 Tax=Halorussus salinus TaxID=1364935 RepID=UPI00109212F0|nr:sulfatase-like hydrolase/transferase [Halorussus salinus]